MWNSRMFMIRNTLLTLLLLFSVQVRLPAQEEKFDRAAVFDEVTNLVKQHFVVDVNENQEWREQVKNLRATAVNAKSHDKFSETINELLASLNMSHTYYYSTHNPKRYQLLGVFEQMYDAKREELFVYEGIGIDTVSIENRVFVSSVFDGLPADSAGIRFGDRIITVDEKAFHPTLSFVGKAKKTVVLKIEREKTVLQIDVPVEKIDARMMFETAATSSAKVIKRNDKKIGYIHVWCYAGTKYQEIVRSSILWGKLKDCDALVLDIRDGWGGADLNYLSLFREPIAVVESKPRSGKGMSYSGVWGKPIALLTNGRSTSGKELFTYGFKKLKLGKVFGANTAGAVVAGRAFLLSNQDVLYLAVSDVKVDGNRLEGVGVQPDIKIPRPVDSAGAKDPQLEAALDFLAK